MYGALNRYYSAKEKSEAWRNGALDRYKNHRSQEQLLLVIQVNFAIAHQPRAGANSDDVLPHQFDGSVVDYHGNHG